MKRRNFNEIYQKLSMQKDPNLEGLRQRKTILGIICVVLIVILFFGMSAFKRSDSIPVFTFIMVSSTVIVVVLSLITSAKYRSLYKQSVINTLVKSYSPDLYFEQNAGISMMEYDRANYREFYDSFRSEDLIQGRIDNEFSIKMSEVHTEKTEYTTDSEGRTQTEHVTVFHGIFGFVLLQDRLFPNFDISTNSFFSKYAKSRVEVDSSNFEKYYDLYAEDKVRTMEIFTSDLIEEFNHVKDELKNPIQVKVDFFRMNMSNAFEAPTFGKALDFDIIYRNFKLIDMPARIVSKILENYQHAKQD